MTNERIRRLPKVVVSDGLGVDSMAIKLRLLTEPEILAAKGYELADVMFMTAMVGSEFKTTQWHNETYALPLMREHGVRYVQVARAGAPAGSLVRKVA